MTSPLDGVRVLDLGGEMSAYGTKILADLGADVVKVEPPGGDRQRRRPPFAGGVPGRLESSLTFAYYNANKRSVRLDWAKSEAELGRLAAGCDVVVISPSARQPVPGWDRDGRSLSWAGPGTVICCLTPYGLDGPLRDRRATQLTAYAGSGGMWSIGPAEGPPRVIPAFPFYDELSAQAAFCIMVALRERPQAGGQVIDLCLHDLLAYRESTAVSFYTIAGRTMTSRNRVPAMPPTGIWDVSDGQVELLIWNPPHWDGFLEIVGRPQDLLDPALRQRGERHARAGQLAPRVRELLAPFTRQGFWDLALTHRVPCAPVNTPLQVTRDPQLASRGFWAEVMAELNPRLIWVSVSGYGRTGPRAKAMAYGTNVNGFMGLTRVWSPHGSQFDYTAVAHVLVTIFAALAHRDRSGQGSYTEIAQSEAGGAMLAPLLLEALATGRDVWPEPNDVPGSYLSGVFAAAGRDAWLAVELEDASDWDAAARLLGVPELSTGQNGPPHDAAVAELKRVIAAWAQTLTPAQGARHLQAAGLAAAAVQEIPDLFADGGIWAHDWLARLDLPDTDNISTWVTGPFQRMRAPRAYVRGPSPHPGQHNEEILRDWLTAGG